MENCKAPRIAVFLLVSSGILACAKKADNSTAVALPTKGVDTTVEVNPVPPTRHTVMVIDKGFDLRNPVFANKIEAAYTLSCPTEKAEPSNGTNWDDMRAKRIEWFKNDHDKGCTLKPVTSDQYLATPTEDPVVLGQKFTATWFVMSGRIASLLSGKKDRWNSALLNKQVFQTFTNEDLNAFYMTLHGVNTTNQQEEYTYHGTNTAGLVAYQNPNVRLVLVHSELDFLPQRILNLAESSSCPSQNNLEQEVTNILLHADTIAAWESAPMNDKEKALEEVAKKHKVTIENRSFGLSPRSIMEAKLRAQGCSLDLRSYYKAETLLQEKRYVALKKAGSYERNNVIQVWAAGNDGATIDSEMDSRECYLDPTNRVVVGAFSANKTISKFSNRGTCVDVYAPGERLVLQAPDGYLNIGDGTSYAAPLVARALSMSADLSLMARSQISAFLAKRDPNTLFVPSSSYPAELFIDSSTKISTYTLWDDAPLLLRNLSTGRIEPQGP